MPRPRKQVHEKTDGKTNALPNRRKRLAIERPKVTYEAARIDAYKLKSLLRAAGKQPRRGKLKTFRGGVEATLTQYITDVANATSMILPNELLAGLDKVEKAAEQLAELLAQREVADAMVRAVDPKRFADAPPFWAPTAAPIFQKLAVDIAAAARSAKTQTSKPKPYAKSGRDNAALNQLFRSLISTWNASFSEKATFGRDLPSPFIKFAEACLQLVNAKPHSTASLAKRCERLAKNDTQEQ